MTAPDSGVVSSSCVGQELHRPSSGIPNDTFALVIMAAEPEEFFEPILILLIEEPSKELLVGLGAFRRVMHSNTAIVLVSHHLEASTFVPPLLNCQLLKSAAMFQAEPRCIPIIELCVPRRF